LARIHKTRSLGDCDEIISRIDTNALL
jgi:hypothetical protein